MGFGVFCAIRHRLLNLQILDFLIFKMGVLLLVRIKLSDLGLERAGSAHSWPLLWGQGGSSYYI